MAFPRINNHTTTGTGLTATAAITLSLRVCLRFSSQTSSKTTRAGTFHIVCLPKQLDTGKPCVTCQDTSRYVTLRGRAAEDRQERRVPATDRRHDSACIVLHHRGSTQSECRFLLSMWCSVPLCLTLHHKTSRPPLARSRRCWVSTSTSTWALLWVCCVSTRTTRKHHHEQARQSEEKLYRSRQWMESTRTNSCGCQRHTS